MTKTQPAVLAALLILAASSAADEPDPKPKSEPVSPRLVRTLPHPDPNSPIWFFRYSPDGRRLAAAGEYSGILQIWDLADGRELARVTPPRGEHGTPDYGALTADWKTTFTVRGDKNVRVDAALGNQTLIVFQRRGPCLGRRHRKTTAADQARGGPRNASGDRIAGRDEARHHRDAIVRADGAPAVAIRGSLPRPFKGRSAGRVGHRIRHARIRPRRQIVCPVDRHSGSRPKPDQSVRRPHCQGNHSARRRAKGEHILPDLFSRGQMDRGRGPEPGGKGVRD